MTLWRQKFDAVERLVYRSNILGSDQRITNTGGGNTSAKIIERDPLTGEKVEVLWVKGSGGRLAHEQTGEFFVALSGQTDRHAKTAMPRTRERAEDTG